jgi:hypothetical protein
MTTPEKPERKKPDVRFELRFDGPDDVAMYRQLQVAAKADGRSVHNLVLRILHEWLREHPHAGSGQA